MSNYAMIKRFKIILERVSKPDYPTKQVVLDTLFKSGFEIKERTLERDFERLRDDFGIEILYDNAQKGYHLDADNRLAAQEMLRFVEILAKGEFLSNTLNTY